MRQINIAAALALVLLLTAGCSNIKQINRITFVTALGIDKTDKGVQVHALVAIPQNFSALSPGAGGGKSSPTYVMTEEGADVAEAIYNMKRKSARDIKFGHMKVLLFSEAVAKAGVYPHLDIFMRREEFQIVSWIGITSGSTKAILTIQPKLPESVSDFLVDVFSKSGTISSEILPIYTFQFYSMIRETDQSPYATMVEEDEGENKIKLTQTVLFRGDKMIGKLSPKETKYLQILQGNLMGPSSFTLPTSNVSLALLSAKTKLRCSESRLSADIRLQFEIDQNYKPQIRTVEDDREELTRTAEQTITSDIEHLLDKLQQLKVDPVGFAGKYRLAVDRKLDMRQWETKLFPQIKTEVTVKAVLFRQGLTY